MNFDQLTEQSRASFKANILLDSINPAGKRLTTFELTYPRIIHSEFMTHRMFSRNAASSRAIPIKKMLERVKNNPFFPLHWGQNEKGMQASKELNDDDKGAAGAQWMLARDRMLHHVSSLEEIGIHKQIGNRLLEPWMWITVICSATQYDNFFALRCHKDAEPHIRLLSDRMYFALKGSQPQEIAWGDYHLPFICKQDRESGLSINELCQVSVGRCARVSYLTHAGIRDPLEDIALYKRLTFQHPLHASPLEHVARAIIDPPWSQNWGNFTPGWQQFRKIHNRECIQNYQP